MTPPGERRRSRNRQAAGSQCAPEECVAAAVERRAALLNDPQTDVARLIHGDGDGLPGLVVERLGPVLIAQLHEGRLALPESRARDLCASLRQRVGAAAVYRKWYPKARSATSAALEAQHRDATPWLGTSAAAALTVREHGLRYVVRPYDGYQTGLFLDHRTARQAVRAGAAGRRILNLFAYTCGFAVAADAGGAASTVNVDLSKRFLEWGKENLVANGADLDRHRFLCTDVFDYFRRAARQGHRFDWVIVDPPTFSRGPRSKRVFTLVDDLERLVAESLALLEPGGVLHVSINHRGTSRGRLRGAVEDAALRLGRSGTWLPTPPRPEDFAGDRDYMKLVLWRVE
jgi:23S rRNA (cytosine1962-C5)-methyltransferase